MAEPSGEISVSLRLVLDQFRADIAKANAMWQQSTPAATAASGAAAADKAGEAMGRLEGKVRRVSDALKAQLEEWRKLNAGGVAPGMKVTESAASLPKAAPSAPAYLRVTGTGLATAPPSLTQPPPLPPQPPPLPPPVPPAQQQALNWSSFVRNIGFLGLPVSNPTSPLAALASFRQSFTALNTQAGQSVVGQFGLSGAGGSAAAAGVLTAAAIAVGLALKGLREAVHETAQAFQNAARLYSSVLRGGGLASGWIVQRGTVASIMGVSEQEVMRVGAAFQELSERTRYATRALTETMPALTGAAWSWRVLGVQFQALFARVASVFAPVVDEALKAVAALVQFAAAAGPWRVVAAALRDAFHSVARIAEGAALAVMGLGLALVALGDSVKYVMVQINNSAARMHIPGFHEVPAHQFNDTSAAWDAFMQMARLFAGQNQIGAPSPLPDPRRLASSPWERMGLVMGVGGQSDYARETAANTRRSAEHLGRIAAALARSGSGLMAPMYNQP